MAIASMSGISHWTSRTPGPQSVPRLSFVARRRAMPHAGQEGHAKEEVYAEGGGQLPVSVGVRPADFAIQLDLGACAAKSWRNGLAGALRRWGPLSGRKRSDAARGKREGS